MENKTIFGKPKVYRQGDVILQEIGVLPKGAKLVGDKISVSGETGHMHTIMGQVYESAETENQILVLEKPTELSHEEHNNMDIDAGIYTVKTVRDYARSTASTMAFD